MANLELASSWIAHAEAYKSSASLLLQAITSAHRWPVNLSLQVAVLVSLQVTHSNLELSIEPAVNG